MNIDYFDPLKLVYCYFCERELSHFTYIKCAECENLFICIKCFANCKEQGDHLHSHKYTVKQNLEIEIGSKGWTALEELKLISSFESSGYGNWGEATKVLKYKNEKECELFFKNNYLNLDVKTNTSLKESFEQEYNNIIEKYNNEQKEPEKCFEEVLGYMKEREDFEVEYDNDAELLLAEMEFTAETEDKEDELKYKILSFYNERLIQRKLRKDFVIKRGILDIKKNNAEDKLKSKEQREIENVLKLFERFHSPEEHRELINDILKERELAKILEDLIAYKSMGFETFKEIEKYNLEKRDNDTNYNNQWKTVSKKISSKNNYENEVNTRANRIKLNANKILNQDKDANSSFLNGDLDISYILNREKKLAEKMGIDFDIFLLIKEAIIRLSIEKGFISKEDCINLTKIDNGKIFKIFDYLVENELIMSNE